MSRENVEKAILSLNREADERMVESMVGRLVTEGIVAEPNAELAREILWEEVANWGATTRGGERHRALGRVPPLDGSGPDGESDDPLGDPLPKRPVVRPLRKSEVSGVDDLADIAKAGMKELRGRRGHILDIDSEREGA